MVKKTTLRWTLCFFIISVLIIIGINNNAFVKIDGDISSFVISHRISWLTSISSISGVLFDPIWISLIIFLVGCSLWFLNKKSESLFLISISICAGALIFLLKHLFTRARPTIQFLAETGYSFPSGHALISVILFGCLIYFGLRIRDNSTRLAVLLVSIFGIILLGLTRIYLNVHWISDILGGYSIGATILLVWIYLDKIGLFRRLL